MKTSRAQSNRAIVLKRSNYGETDRIVTLYTDLQGKISTMAKGCRKLKSSRLSSLEPGMYISAYLITTKGMPLLTEARVLKHHPNARVSLHGIRKVTQVLEVIDRLTVEEPNADVFEYTLSLLHNVDQNLLSNAQIRSALSNLIELLGFQSLKDTQYTSINEYVGTLSDRPLKSFSYLTVNR